MLDTAVLFIIFNRPLMTQLVFNEIKKVKPKKLFICGDGPREHELGEKEKCEQARHIVNEIDWNCTVHTLFHSDNLGCKQAVSTGINWFFENVDEGIILEDDCLPDHSFFQFSEELLIYFRHDNRIMQICGSNFLRGWKRNDYSYYFSLYGPIWGWASWRRAWKYYDVDMKLWPIIKKGRLYEDFCLNQEEAEFRKQLYEKVFSGEIDTWDYQWGFSKMINSGLSIIPNVNLISNIGFGHDSTHTGTPSDPFANMKTESVSFPLRRPEFVIVDRLADEKYFNNFVLRK